MPWKRRLPRTYAEQTYASPHWVVRYPHRKRLERAARLVRQYRPNSLLDYGAGDGRLFRLLLDDAVFVPPRLVAFEPVDPDHLVEQTASLGHKDICVRSAYDDLFAESYDVIICLSVLEHMPLRERDKFFRLCTERLNPDGRCIIDVPVEVGPTLLIKHLGRTLLKGRPSEYTWRELLKLTLGSTIVDPSRYDGVTQNTWIQDHKGFDYRVFRRELRKVLQIEASHSTPFEHLPPWLGNQEVFYVARRPSPPDAQT